MVIGTLLIRNEEEIISECIEFHLSNGVDKFIVTDNASEDNTRKILEKYKVEIIDEPELNYQQGAWVTRMARIAAQYNPDWIVHIDADEFWHGLKTLKDIPDKFGVVYLPHYYYEHSPVENMVYGKFRRSHVPYYVKMKSGGRLVHRPSKNIIVAQGNHKLENYVGEVLQLENDQICMHHYSVRSYGHFEQKIIAGGKAYEKYPGNSGDGSHWRKLYKLWQEGGLPEFYDSLVLTQERINEGLKSGELKGVKVF